MIHYSCDRCKRVLDSDEVRYRVCVEVTTPLEPMEVDDPEDDRDHLAEIHDILERLTEEEIETLSEDVGRLLRFDLCRGCYRKFAQFPVGREPAEQFGFSEN
jgi:hypothetical protein